MTDIERLLLINQYQLKVALGADDPLDNLRIEILINGYAADYHQYIYNEIQPELIVKDCDFVVEILRIVDLLQTFNPNFEWHGFSRKNPDLAKYARHLRSRYLFPDVKCENDDFLSAPRLQNNREMLNNFNAKGSTLGPFTEEDFNFIIGK